MAMDQATKAELAEFLENAELEAREVVKITDEYPDLTLTEAYEINDLIRDRKLARGTKQVGFKMGLTSKAKMDQMGVNRPGFGYLFDYFAIPDGGEINTAELIHPKVEPEIAVVLKTALKGPGCTIADVFAAIDFVLPAMEVIDSRYENFRFDLVSVIADNSSSSRFVTGGQSATVDEIDMKTMGVVMEINGEVVALGAGAAVIGHPANAVAMLANSLAEKGEEVPAGSFIMTGALTAAQAVKPGDSVTVSYQGLGSISARVV
ncbi:MAG: 2-oxo-3-hexenedioate decarboxylase [Immundisolibacteraceae bacterium]|jgi:2-oxo-3-hexenedioate decarboxylase|nr:2-oxo-3-hexenedioate decarboxylase [Immundisolibacteraceae bacterium]